jgi:isopentenyl-diphosphate delta-isomerase
MIGYYDEDPVVNPAEVAGWKWMKPSAVKDDLRANGKTYTVWFRIIFEKFYDHFIKMEHQV